MSRGVFRRCGCRDVAGMQYAVLPDEATSAQRERSCPAMAQDPKHGRWSFRISAGMDPVSKRRRQVNGKSYPTKREAQKARNEAAVKVDKGNYLAPSRETFSAYLPRWLERAQRTGKGLRPSTVENYARYIEQDIAPSGLGGLRLEEIRRHHINDFIDQLLEAKRGAVTVRRIVAVVQGSLRAAAIDQRIEVSPATMLRLPKVDTDPFTPWEPAQVGTFLDTAAEHRLGALFEVAVFTGLRRGELLGLGWEDIDFTRRVVSVRRNRTTAGEGQTKTDAGMRTVDLDDRSVGALVAWKIAQVAEAEEWGPAYSPSGYVFTYEDGSPLKPQYVTRLFDKLRARAHLPVMTLHGLRHMSASLMIASGTELVVVSKRLGHSSISITSDIYGHLIGSASRDAANMAASLVPAKRTTAHTMHAQRASNAEEAAPDFSETASDLHVSQSG
jgi:integrase